MPMKAISNPVILPMQSSYLSVGVHHISVSRQVVLHYRQKELAEQSLFYRNDKMEESPGSIGQGAR